MQTIDIAVPGLILVYALLLIPLWLFHTYGLGLVREALVAVTRMTIQLVLVGLYLKIIFEINSPWLSGLWVAAMIAIANATVIHKAGLRRQTFFAMTIVGLAGGAALVVGVLVFGVVRPDPIYDARYLIPITGMVLGNCMRGNVISLERFYTGIRDNQKLYVTNLLMGASHTEAVRPFLRPALRAALAPSLSTMATMGLVSLPGMMTGQILGGSFPLTAIKYQLAIMICIFSAITVSNVLNIRLSMRHAFDDYQMLRDDIFAT